MIVNSSHTSPVTRLNRFQLCYHCRTQVRDSSVGIATRYGLDGPGFESRLERDFSIPVNTGPGVRPASYTMGTGSFPGVKRPGRGVGHQPTFSAEVKE